MTTRKILLLLSLLAASAMASAQDYQAMADALEKAQAEASKPGDDKLTCDQLEEQLVAVTQNPEFQARMAAMGADAQHRQDAMNAAKSQIAMQTIRTVMMSAIPGAAMPGMAAAQAQAQAQGAAGMKDTAARMQEAQKLIPLMPMLMRGQRVVELAVAKKCEWAQGAGMEQ